MPLMCAGTYSAVTGWLRYVSGETLINLPGLRAGSVGSLDRPTACPTHTYQPYTFIEAMFICEQSLGEWFEYERCED